MTPRPHKPKSRRKQLAPHTAEDLATPLTPEALHRDAVAFYNSRDSLVGQGAAFIFALFSALIVVVIKGQTLFDKIDKSIPASMGHSLGWAITGCIGFSALLGLAVDVLANHSTKKAARNFIKNLEDGKRESSFMKSLEKRDRYFLEVVTKKPWLEKCFLKEWWKDRKTARKGGIEVEGEVFSLTFIFLLAVWELAILVRIAQVQQGLWAVAGCTVLVIWSAYWVLRMSYAPACGRTWAAFLVLVVGVGTVFLLMRAMFS